MKHENNKKVVPLPKKEAFENKTLSLFQDFLVNTDEQRDQASNSIELWDSVPRYSISQQAMNKLRGKNGLLDLLKINFNYKQTSLQAVIQPALIQELRDGIEQTVAYYPSANEELVEEALRKIATIQNMGFHEENKRSGVVFTIHQLREELKQRGHERSYSQVVQSLNILSLSIIEINSNDKNIKTFARSAYFPLMSGYTSEDPNDELPNKKWQVQFHPLVTDSLDKLTYRQFNYKQLMSHSTQLARWIHKYLINKYTFASKMKPFEIRYSTIKRDSAMLNNHTRETNAVKACDFSINELITQNVVSKVDIEIKRGLRGKIEDVIYTLTPTLEFVAEVKASNARYTKIKNP